MQIVAAVLNLLIFIAFLIGLIWLAIGFWVGLIVIIIKLMQKEKLNKKWILVMLGGIPWLVVVMILWVVLNVVMQLTGNSSLNSSLPIPSR